MRGAVADPLGLRGSHVSQKQATAATAATRGSVSPRLLDRLRNLSSTFTYKSRPVAAGASRGRHCVRSVAGSSVWKGVRCAGAQVNRPSPALQQDAETSPPRSSQRHRGAAEGDALHRGVICYLLGSCEQVNGASVLRSEVFG